MAQVVADVFDVVLIDSNGDVFGSTTLQDAGIEVQVQENDIRAGKGNQLHGVLHSDRDITINLTDISFRYEWLAKQLGQSIVTGAGVAWAMPKWYDVKTGLVVNLPSTPTSGATVAVYDSAGVKLSGTLTGSNYTISSGVVVGDTVEVRTYSYATSASTKTISIDNSVFAKGVKAVLETVEIDSTTETATHTLQWQFDNALPSGNFNINTSSAKEAITQEFNLRVIKPKTTNVVGRSLRIPI